MPVSVLVEGMDLTGKTTLSRLLVAELETRGLTAVHRRGFLASRHPMRRLLERTAPGDKPSSRLLNAAFVAGALMDRVLPGILDDDSDVVVHESYVDRAIAYGVAEGSWPVARLAARWPHAFAAFDLVVLTHAPLEVRQARLRERGSTSDRVDARTVRSAHFEQSFVDVLQHVARRHRRLMRADSTAQPAKAIAAKIAEQVVSLACPAPALGRQR